MTTQAESVAARRRAVVVAGHTGDVVVVRGALHDADAVVRASALGAAQRLGVLDADDVVAALADDDATVRVRAAEIAAAHIDVDLLGALHDADDDVVEVACWSCGEHVEVRDAVFQRLVDLATASPAPLVRESAIAALGAIGDVRGLPAILAGTRDKPAVRRRAVLALAPFEGPEVDEAIERARQDRDWQVRQSADDIAPES